jgi:uncharacterized protein (TIGR03382 family)
VPAAGRRRPRRRPDLRWWLDARADANEGSGTGSDGCAAGGGGGSLALVAAIGALVARRRRR